MLGKVAEAGRWAGERWGRIILLILQVLILAALTFGALVALQDVAGA